MLKLSDRLHTQAKGRLILSIFAALVLFMVITLPLLSRIYPAADEMESLDDPVFYTPDEIFSTMESWGEDGRNYQLWLHLTWDLIFPIMGFLFISLFISWLLQRSFGPESKLQRLNLLALGSVFDLLENVCLIGLLLVSKVRGQLFARRLRLDNLLLSFLKLCFKGLLVLRESLYFFC